MTTEQQGRIRWNLTNLTSLVKISKTSSMVITWLLSRNDEYERSDHQFISEAQYSAQHQKSHVSTSKLLLENGRARATVHDTEDEAARIYLLLPTT